MVGEPKVWRTEGREKSAGVRALFAAIAPIYDRTNDLMSFGLHHRWRARVVRELGLRQGEAALDICCGTGDFVLPLRKAVGPSGSVVAMDFCFPMLKIASRKTVPADLAAADATCLPLASDSFDGVTVGWGIRNVADIDRAHQEIFRVLKPGGRFGSIDMARPKFGLGAFAARCFDLLTPIVGGRGKSDHYRYLSESTKRFWSPDRLAESIKQAGFVEVRHRKLMLGNLYMHFGVKPQ